MIHHQILSIHIICFPHLRQQLLLNIRCGHCVCFCRRRQCRAVGKVFVEDDQIFKAHRLNPTDVCEITYSPFAIRSATICATSLLSTMKLMTSGCDELVAFFAEGKSVSPESTSMR